MTNACIVYHMVQIQKYICPSPEVEEFITEDSNNFTVLRVITFHNLMRIVETHPLPFPSSLLKYKTRSVRCFNCLHSFLTLTLPFKIDTATIQGMYKLTGKIP